MNGSNILQKRKQDSKFKKSRGEPFGFLRFLLTNIAIYAKMSARQKNKRMPSGGNVRCRGSFFFLGDKEIAVKVRGNSHYRNSRFDESSRNAYRPVMPIKVSRASGEVVRSGMAGSRFLGKLGRCVKILVREQL